MKNWMVGLVMIGASVFTPAGLADSGHRHLHFTRYPNTEVT